MSTKCMHSADLLCVTAAFARVICAHDVYRQGTDAEQRCMMHRLQDLCHLIVTFVSQYSLDAEFAIPLGIAQNFDAGTLCAAC